MANTQEVSETRLISLINDIKNLLTSKEIDDKWMDSNKASEYCGVSTATLRRNVISEKHPKGTLKASNKTGKLLFKKSELEEWLNG